MKKHLINTCFILPLFAIGVLATACNKDEQGKQPIPTNLIGSYEGTAELFYTTPQADEQPAPENPILATVDQENILLKNFPAGEIVKLFVEGAEADEIIAAIGEVEYSIAYTALQKEDLIALTLSSEPLTIELPVMNPLIGDQAQKQVIKVSIESPKEGSYISKDKQLSFKLAITEIALNDTPLETLPENLTIDFSLTKSISNK